MRNGIIKKHDMLCVVPNKYDCNLQSEFIFSGIQLNWNMEYHNNDRTGMHFFIFLKMKKILKSGSNFSIHFHFEIII